MDTLFKQISNQRQLISLIRVFNSRTVFLFYTLGRALAGTFRFDTPMLFAFCIFVSANTYAVLLNNKLDSAIDKANRRDIPHLNASFLRYISIGAVVLSILVAMLDGFVMSYIASMILFLLALMYSHPSIKASYHPIGKIVVMSLGYTVIPALYGFLHLGYSSHQPLYSLLPFCLFYTSWMLFSDVKDIKGDQMGGKITLAVMLGVKRLSIVGFLVSSVSILLLWVSGFSQSEILIFLIFLLVYQGTFMFWPRLLEVRTLRILEGYIFTFLLVWLSFSFI